MWCLAVLAFLFPVVLHAGPFDDLAPDTHRRYLIRLLSGDILIGTIIDISEDSYTLWLRTAVGTATINAPQVAEVMPMERAYSHGHRLFFMPTAQPVSTDFYLGLYELFMPYGGVGLGDVLSITGGRTAVPGLQLEEQATLLNLKATVYERRSTDDDVFVALGGHSTWLNAANDMGHVYSAATWSRDGLSLSGLVFVKVYGSDTMNIHMGKYGSVTMHYSGLVGAALGFDIPVAQRFDLRLIGELWCSDITRIRHSSAALLGLRLWNTDIAADVGLAIVPEPSVAPVVNVVWTPRIHR